MPFTYDPYKESDRVKKYQTDLDEVLGRRPEDWDQSNNYKPVQIALDKINNRKPFTYDINGDMLYNQYKDQYMTQGKQAMMDAMGQASAMTGGYGNSYAQTVGQQTYQGYLQGLNDKVPELYQLALSKYNQEGNDLMNQYALAKDAYDTSYGEYKDTVSRWNADRDYAYGMYNDERNLDYGMYSDAYNKAMNMYQNDQAEQIAALQNQINNDYISKEDIEVDDDGNIVSVSGFDLAKDKVLKSLKDRDWVVESKGGLNWWGVDRNAKVKDQDGNIYTLNELRNALIAEGMSKEDAKDYVIKLQKQLGISNRG